MGGLTVAELAELVSAIGPWGAVTLLGLAYRPLVSRAIDKVCGHLEERSRREDGRPSQ